MQAKTANPMTITGRDFKGFMSNPLYWPKGVFMSEVEIHVDGVPLMYEDDADMALISDASTVQFIAGDVFDGPMGDVHIHSLEDHYASFQSKAECDSSLSVKERLALRAAIEKLNEFVVLAGAIPTTDDEVKSELEFAIEKYLIRCRAA